MVKITGEYQGDLHCSATHGPSGQVLATDAPKDNQGKGEAFSPTDLTATSLAVCMSTIMAMAARKHGVELRGLRFEVTKEMSKDLPRRIVKLSTTFWMPCLKSALPDGAVERAAETCPVHLSLHPAIEKPVVFHWPQA
jgi:putative redox protein